MAAARKTNAKKQNNDESIWAPVGEILTSPRKTGEFVAESVIRYGVAIGLVKGGGYLYKVGKEKFSSKK